MEKSKGFALVNDKGSAFEFNDGVIEVAVHPQEVAAHLATVKFCPSTVGVRELAARMVAWANAQDARDLVADATTSADAPSSSPPVASAPDGLLRCAVTVEQLELVDGKASAALAGKRMDDKGGGEMRFVVTGLTPGESKQLGQHFGRNKGIVLALSVAPPAAKGAPSK